jgi:hypothetical protein
MSMTPHPTELSVELVSLVNAGASVESVAKWADSARVRLNWLAPSDMDYLLDQLSSMTMGHNMILPSSEILIIADRIGKCTASGEYAERLQLEAKLKNNSL